MTQTDKSINNTVDSAELAKLQDHNKWLQAELDRYQKAGCIAVAERLRNQADTIGDLKVALERAKQDPNQDVWDNGFHCGHEAARLLYRGEYPRHQKEFWDDFVKSVTPKEVSNG